MWAQFLIAITGPVVQRVLLTLGLGVVSYTGFSAVLASVHNIIQQSFNGLPADVIQLIFLSGLPQGMAIILSALAARISFTSISKIQRLN